MATTTPARKQTAKKTTAKKDEPTRARRQAEIQKLAARVDDDDLQISDEEFERLSGMVGEEIKDLPDSPIGPDGEIRPIEIGKDGKAGDDLAHLFTLAGEKFYIRKTAPVPIMLRFIRECRPPELGGLGRDIAVERAMLSMLGKRSLDALCESSDTSDENFAHVFIVVGHILFTSIKEWRAAVNPMLDPSKSAPSN